MKFVRTANRILISGNQFVKISGDAWLVCHGKGCLGAPRFNDTRSPLGQDASKVVAKSNAWLKQRPWAFRHPHGGSPGMR